MLRALRPLRVALVGAALLAGATAGLGVGSGCGPLPGERGGAATPPPDIVTVPTGDGRYFYLVDTRRAVCFFGDRYRPQLTKVSCEEIPEAWDLLGWEPGDGSADDGDDGGTIPPLAPPDDGDTVNGDIVEPPPAEERDPGPPPTDEERQAFEAAFVETFCASRSPGDDDTGPPDEAAIAERHGLTSERYEQLRDHLAADAEAWRALSARAIEACP